jgi:hypothetical protein
MAQADVETQTARTSEHSARYRLAGLVLVAAVLAVNIYRAAHQSITIDEAFTYDLYIVNPFNWILTQYNANNHVLHTLLCRFSVQALGLSELSMRLPSLLGGLLYLIFVYKLCRHLFKTWWTFLLAMAALTLNPFIMDYLSIARGYGMALGLFMAALYLDIRFLDDPWKPARFDRAGAAAILLGLSISANLVFLFPAIALAGTLSVVLAADVKQTRSWKERLSWIADRIWLRMAAPAVFFLAIPLAHAASDAFGFGTDSLRRTLWTVVTRSLFHQYDVWTYGSTPPIAVRTVDITTDWVVPLGLVVLLVTLAPVCWNWLRERDLQRLSKLERACALTVAVPAICALMVTAAHVLHGTYYPSDRTALYLAVLLTLAWILLIERALARPGIYPALGLLAGAPIAIAIVLFLRGFTTSFYYEWRYDAGSKRAFQFLHQQALQSHNRFSGANPMKVEVDWKSSYTFNFYRNMYHADWMARVVRRPAPEADADYYVLLPEDQEAARKLGLRMLYRDPVSRQEVSVSGASGVLASASSAIKE